MAKNSASTPTLWGKALPYIIGAAGGFAAAFLALKTLQRIEDGPRIARRTASGNRAAPRRCAGMCKLRPGMYEQYTTLHDNTWAEVMEQMMDANMRNFVVYLHEESGIMFHHFEYIGSDFEADMAKCRANPKIRKWWSYCEPCQIPAQWSGAYPSAGGSGDSKGDSWWAGMKCLNHCGGWPTAWSSECPDPDFASNRSNKDAVSSFAVPGDLEHNRSAETTAKLAAELDRLGCRHEM